VLENKDDHRSNACPIDYDTVAKVCPAAQALLDLREPIFGLTTAARVCERWLRQEPTDLGEVKLLLAGIIRTSEAATAILNRAGSID